MSEVAGFYERHWARFDQERTRVLVEASDIDWLTSGLGPGAHLLDIGCGMGEPIARDLLARGFHVTGVDASASMIALCRKRFPFATWIEADMRSLDLVEEFDGVIAWDSLFHLSRDDQRATIPVLARHLSATGRLVFTSGPADGERTNPLWGEPLYHASLAPEEYRARLAAEGFDDIAFRPEDRDVGGRSVWRARRR